MDKYYIQEVGDRLRLRYRFEGCNFTCGLFPSTMSREQCEAFVSALNRGREVARNMMESVLENTKTHRLSTFEALVPNQKPFFNNAYSSL